MLNATIPELRREMDRPRGDVHLLLGRALPADAQGAHPAPDHSQPDRGRRISRHESIWKGENTEKKQFLQKFAKLWRFFFSTTQDVIGHVCSSDQSAKVQIDFSMYFAVCFESPAESHVRGQA